MFGSDLQELFTQLARARGWRDPPGVQEAVERWRSVVDQCSGGYSLGYFEYTHDLLVRGLLDAALRDAAFRADSGFTSFSASVEAIDRDFREVCESGHRIRVDPERWWTEFIPGAGGECFAEEVLDVLQIRITDLDSDRDG